MQKLRNFGASKKTLVCRRLSEENQVSFDQQLGEAPRDVSAFIIKKMSNEPHLPFARIFGPRFIPIEAMIVALTQDGSKNIEFNLTASETKSKTLHESQTLDFLPGYPKESESEFQFCSIGPGQHPNLWGLARSGSLGL